MKNQAQVIIDKNGDGFEVVSGHRRFEALTKMKANIIALDVATQKEFILKLSNSGEYVIAAEVGN